MICELRKEQGLTLMIILAQFWCLIPANVCFFFWGVINKLDTKSSII